jgi:putative SOS response-associated peptidase YedK
MCGRYRLKEPKAAFAALEVVSTADFLPRFNIAPTQSVAVIPAAGRVEPMTWGIVPVWATEKSKPLINARSETIREKRSFKSAFAIAGIWEPGDERRCCLLTTTANSLLGKIHDRMPVIVRREDWEEWFAPGELADRSFLRITTPYGPEEMSMFEVAPLVNSAAVDEPRCCEPVTGQPLPSRPGVKKSPSNPDAQQTFSF